MDQGRFNRFETQFKKVKKFLFRTRPIMPTNEKRLNLRIVQKIPQQLPQAVAIEGAEDRDGAGGWVQVHPGFPEARDDIIRFGPQGYYPDMAVGIDDRQAVAEMQGDEFHGFLLYQNPR